jgi:hypothetical protein
MDGVLVNLMPSFSWCPAVLLFINGTVEDGAVGDITVFLLRVLDICECNFKGGGAS